MKSIKARARCLSLGQHQGREVLTEALEPLWVLQTQELGEEKMGRREVPVWGLDISAARSPGRRQWEKSGLSPRDQVARSNPKTVWE